VNNKQIFFRAFPASLEARSTQQGHSLTGRLVPYNEAVDVLDELPDGKMDIYREGFKPGAFSKQVNFHQANTKRVLKIGLNHRHDGGLGYLGPFVRLDERDDGLYGEAVILPTKADDVEALLRAGVNELSVEFRLPGGDNTKIADGVRWRTNAYLDGVALEPNGAYSSAQVMAYRSELDQVEAENAKVEAERQAEEKKALELEAEAEAEIERKRAMREQWDALTSRIDSDLVRQREYVERLGITEASGNRRRPG
jgi:HK97 family phage prohead protease